MLKYSLMKISVIIPTLNAGMRLKELLPLLLKQDTKPSEIIIIDSSSEDNTVDIARQFYARTIVIPKEDFNHGRTRNLAAAEAVGDMFVFMTQDALPVSNTLLSNLVDPLHDANIAASYGRHIPRPDASPLERFARQFNYPDNKIIKGMEDIQKYGIRTFFFSDACSAIRKDVFLKIGMFPENIRVNEDMLLAAKLIMNGYKIAYVPDASVMHSHSYSLFQLAKRYYNIGFSLKRNAWILKHAQAEGEGIRFVREQISFVLKEHKYQWLPYIFLEAAAKYAGYKIGLSAG